MLGARSAGDGALGLSGEQQQRLCIARVLAVEPDVLLMDEPCSALDPIATGKVEELIHELQRDFTIVIVTHNMQQAARVSDQTAFFTAELDRETDRRTGVLVEYDQTARIADAMAASTFAPSSSSRSRSRVSSASYSRSVWVCGIARLTRTAR